jgi:hypothetical protein
MYFFLQEAYVYLPLMVLYCGLFVSKSDAIAAQAESASKIEAYIKSTFNVEKSAQPFTTDEKTTLTHWWQDERKRDPSLSKIRNLPRNIYLNLNGKHVSCIVCPLSMFVVIVNSHI